MAGSFRDLTVFKKAFSLAMEVFEVTKKFPSEEKYAKHAVATGEGSVPMTV